MNSTIIKFFLVIISSLLITSFSWGQSVEAPSLPDFNLETKDGFNIISFYSIYEGGINAITVSRSTDSNINFTTIGAIPKRNKGIAVYVDAHPSVGKNWYQVKIEFSSGVEFKSIVKSVVLDSAQIKSQKTIVSSEALQVAANNAVDKAQSVAKVVEDQTQEIVYPKSVYVYTNPFTGDINIELKDALSTNYKLEFYDTNKKKVLFVPRVNENMVILDKRNFNKLGIYSFKLYKNNTIFEEGFVSIY